MRGERDKRREEGEGGGGKQRERGRERETGRGSGGEGERGREKGREEGGEKERGRERGRERKREGKMREGEREEGRESKDNEGRHLYSEKNRSLCRLPWRLFDKDWLSPPYTPPLRDTRLSTGTSGSPQIRRSTPGSTARSPRASLSTSRGNHQCSSWRGRYATSPASFILSLSPPASIGMHVA